MKSDPPLNRQRFVESPANQVRFPANCRVVYLETMVTTLSGSSSSTMPTLSPPKGSFDISFGRQRLDSASVPSMPREVQKGSVQIAARSTPIWSAVPKRKSQQASKVACGTGQISFERPVTVLSDRRSLHPEGTTHRCTN